MEAARGNIHALLSEVRAGRLRTSRLRVVRLGPDAGESKNGSSAKTRLVHRDLTGAVPTEEERAMARLVPKLIEELRLRSGRRLRRSRQGRLWVRKVFRENLAHGGIPFVLPFRRPRPRRPRVVLLVDVSFSVSRAASFFVWMVSEFLRLGRDGRVIAFVDRPVDATIAFSRWRDRGHGASSPTGAVRLRGEGVRRGGVSFPDVLRSLPRLNLDAPSDYGRAFHALLHSELRPTGKDTVLVILGDARTNRFDPLPWTLEEIRRRCRTVIWLVPEPAERWGTADSALAAYLPWVDVAVEAKDLAGLSRGLAELLRKL